MMCGGSFCVWSILVAAVFWLAGSPSQSKPVGFARFPLLSPAVTSSPGAGEVFPLRESQAVKFITKVSGEMRKLPTVLLALPLGELAKP